MPQGTITIHIAAFSIDSVELECVYEDMTMVLHWPLREMHVMHGLRSLALYLYVF